MSDAKEAVRLEDQTPEQIRKWWDGLTDDQRGEVSFYADAHAWSIITRACHCREAK